MALLCASALAAQSSDFTDRVTEMLLLEASERLSLPVAQIEMIHLGLNNVSCPDDAEVSLHIPASEDFRGGVDVYIEATDGSDAAGNGLQSRLAVYKSLWLLRQPLLPVSGFKCQ